MFSSYIELRKWSDKVGCQGPKCTDVWGVVGWQVQGPRSKLLVKSGRPTSGQSVGSSWPSWASWSSWRSSGRPDLPGRASCGPGLGPGGGGLTCVASSPVRRPPQPHQPPHQSPIHHHHLLPPRTIFRSISYFRRAGNLLKAVSGYICAGGRLGVQNSTGGRK